METPRHDDSTTVFGTDEEGSIVKRRKKRRSLGRRVSFAEAPAYHIFTRDDEYVSPSHDAQNAEGSAPQEAAKRRSPRLASKREGVDSDDKENWRPVVSNAGDGCVRRRGLKPLSSGEQTVVSPASRPPSRDDGDICFIDVEDTSKVGSFLQKDPDMDEEVTLDSTTFTLKISQLHNFRSQSTGYQDMVIESAPSVKKSSRIRAGRESPAPFSGERDMSMSLTMIKPFVRPKLVELQSGHVDGNTDMSLTMQVPRKQSSFLGLDPNKQAEVIEILKASFSAEHGDHSSDSDSSRLPNSNPLKLVKSSRDTRERPAIPDKENIVITRAPGSRQAGENVKSATYAEVRKENATLAAIAEDGGSGKLINTAFCAESVKDIPITTINYPEEIKDIASGSAAGCDYEEELPCSPASYGRMDATVTMDVTVSPTSASALESRGHQGSASEPDHIKISTKPGILDLVLQELTILPEKEGPPVTGNDEKVVITKGSEDRPRDNTIAIESEKENLVITELSGKGRGYMGTTDITVEIGKEIITNTTDFGGQNDSLSAPSFSVGLEEVDPGLSATYQSEEATLDMSVSPASTASLAHGECKRPSGELDRSITMDIPSLQDLVQEEEDEDMVTDMKMDTDMAIPRLADIIKKEEEEDDTDMEEQETAPQKITFLSSLCEFQNIPSSSEGDFTGSITAQVPRCSDLLSADSVSPDSAPAWNNSRRSSWVAPPPSSLASTEFEESEAGCKTCATPSSDPGMESSPNRRNMTPTSDSGESMDVVGDATNSTFRLSSVWEKVSQLENRTPTDCSGQMEIVDETIKTLDLDVVDEAINLPFGSSKRAKVSQDSEHGTPTPPPSPRIHDAKELINSVLQSAKRSRLAAMGTVDKNLTTTSETTEVQQDSRSILRGSLGLQLNSATTQFNKYKEVEQVSSQADQSLGQHIRGKDGDNITVEEFFRLAEVQFCAKPERSSDDTKEPSSIQAYELYTFDDALRHSFLVTPRLVHMKEACNVVQESLRTSEARLEEALTAPNPSLFSLFQLHVKEFREGKRFLEENYKQILHLQAGISSKALKVDKSAPKADEGKAQNEFALDKIKYLKEQLVDVTSRHATKREILLKGTQIAKEAWRTSKERVEVAQCRLHDSQTKLAKNVRMGHSQAASDQIAARPDFYVKEMMNKVSVLKALQGGWQVIVDGRDVIELSYTRRYLLENMGLLKRRMVITKSAAVQYVTKSTWELDFANIERMFSSINAVDAFKHTLMDRANVRKPQKLRSCIQATRFLVSNFLVLMEEVERCQKVTKAFARGILVVPRFLLENDEHMQLEIKFIDCLIYAKFFLTLDMTCAQLNGYPFGAMPTKVDISYCPRSYCHKLTSAALEDAVVGVEPGYHRVERVCAAVGSFLASVRN